MAGRSWLPECKAAFVACANVDRQLADEMDHFPTGSHQKPLRMMFIAQARIPTIMSVSPSLLIMHDPMCIR